jgi:HAD superfamily hydrolase (TIGR01459 family)
MLKQVQHDRKADMKPITSIHDIAEQYDAFLIDLWGVMHNGTQLYSGAKAAIDALHGAGKQLIFLSNAPRKAEAAEAKLLEFGIAREQFVQVVTSGQVAHDQLAASNPYGAHYYYLGPSKDEEVLDGLAGLSCVAHPFEADFILNTGFETDFQPEADIEPLLQALRAENLPLLCVNPDLEVITPRGQLLCAGWVARRYAQLGGHVDYVGKPHKAVYETCFNLLQDGARICAIGDNLLTDILGANGVGIDSLLITGGILKSESGEHPGPETLRALCAEAGAEPTYVAELFCA